MKAKIKDISEFDIEYDEKIQSIKKRKRSLKMLLDSETIKRIKKDLKAEQRSVKRGTRNMLKKYIRDEIERNEK